MIVSVHRRAVNLRFDGGPLVGLLPPGRPVHPWAVTAAVDPRSLAMGARFECEGGRLLLGPHELDASGAESLALTLTGPAALPAADAAARLTAAAEGTDGAPEAADAAIRGALASLVERGEVRVLAGLVGLGEGLTPSGDDVLVGLLAGLELRSRTGDPAARRKRAALVEALPADLGARTPLLSAQLLAEARDGRYPEPLLALLQALQTPDPAAVEAAAQALAALGHRSGRATLLGVAAALRS